jgi:hypothetical protein
MTDKPAVFDCSGTVIAGCLIHSSPTLCAVCEEGKLLNQAKGACLTAIGTAPNAVTPAAAGSGCVNQWVTGTADTGICDCKAKVVSAASATPGCGAALSLPADCDVFTGVPGAAPTDQLCAKCVVGKTLAADKKSCAAPAADKVGCGDLACTWCEEGYWQVEAAKCTKTAPGAAANKLIVAAGMILALMFANL